MTGPELNTIVSIYAPGMILVPGYVQAESFWMERSRPAIDQPWRPRAAPPRQDWKPLPAPKPWRW